MTDSELEALLTGIESDRVERKQSLSDMDRIRQAICAFANDLPEHNLPGVLPFPSLDVQKRRLKNNDLAVVIVHPANAPPVRFKGTIWIRSGPRRGIANPDDERRLTEKRRFRDCPADIRPIVDARLDAIDELLFQRTYLPNTVERDVLDQNQRSSEDQLLAVKFAHPGPPVCPTVLGVLAVGKAPTDWVAGAYIQFLRIDGAALGDPVRNQREVRGALPDLLEETEDIIKNNVQSAADFASSSVEVRIPDYPVVALQQIVRNAVLHRSYENTNAPVRVYWFNDRVEVHNPGGPYGQVTKENFGQGPTDYRNPNLAAVMKELGYVQRFGYGITLARDAMNNNGNPEPEFQVADAYVAVILRRRP